MEDVLAVYTRPYNPDYPVVCMDETSKQHVKEIRTPLPAIPGKPMRYDSEYERNGVSNMFMFFEPLAGKRYINVTDSRTAVDWAIQIKEMADIRYPDAEKITLVADNLNTHVGASLYKAFAPKEARRILDRLEIHYTPKHGSWLNMAEIEFSILSKQCLDRRIPDQKSMKKEISIWEKERNGHSTPMKWRFTTEDARIKLQLIRDGVLVCLSITPLTLQTTKKIIISHQTGFILKEKK